MACRVKSRPFVIYNVINGQCLDTDRPGATAQCPMGPAARAKKGSLRRVIKENGRLLPEGNKSHYFMTRIYGRGSFLYSEDIFIMDVLTKFNVILVALLREDKLTA